MLHVRIDFERSSVQRLNIILYLNIIRQYLMAKTMRNSMKHAEHDGIKTSKRYCDIKIFSRLGTCTACLSNSYQ